MYFFSRELKLCFKDIIQLFLSFDQAEFFVLLEVFCSRLFFPFCRNYILSCFYLRSCLAISKSTFKVCISILQALFCCSSFFIQFQQPVEASLMYSSFILLISFCCWLMFCIQQNRSSSIYIFFFPSFTVTNGIEIVLVQAIFFIYLFKSQFYLYRSANWIISSPFQRVIWVSSRYRVITFFLYYSTQLLYCKFILKQLGFSVKLDSFMERPQELKLNGSYLGEMYSELLLILWLPSIQLCEYLLKNSFFYSYMQSSIIQTSELAIQYLLLPQCKFPYINSILFSSLALKLGFVSIVSIWAKDAKFQINLISSYYLSLFFCFFSPLLKSIVRNVQVKASLNYAIFFYGTSSTNPFNYTFRALLYTFGTSLTEQYCISISESLIYNQTAIIQLHLSQCYWLLLLDSVRQGQIHSGQGNQEQDAHYPQGFLLASFGFHLGLDLPFYFFLLLPSLLLCELTFLLLFLSCLFFDFFLLSDNSLFFSSFFHFDLVESFFFIVGLDLLNRQSLFVSDTQIDSQIFASCLQFLGNSLQVFEYCFMNGSVSIVILMIDEKLSIYGCQQRVMLQFVQNGYNIVAFIVFDSQDQACVCLLIKFFSIIQSRLFDQKIKALRLTFSDSQIEEAPVVINRFVDIKFFVDQFFEDIVMRGIPYGDVESSLSIIILSAIVYMKLQQSTHNFNIVKPHSHLQG